MEHDLLAPSGKTAKFETVGTLHKGVVVAREQRQQRDMDGKPKYWDDGGAMMEVVLTIQTDERDDAGDDGIRKLYVRGQMLKAVKAAVSAAQAPTVDIGGTIAIKYDSDGEASKPGFTPPKLYSAQYRPPAVTPGSTDLLGTPVAAAPVAPAAVASDLI